MRQRRAHLCRLARTDANSFDRVIERGQHLINEPLSCLLLLQPPARIEQVGKGVSGQIKPCQIKTLSAPPQVQADYLDRNEGGGGALRASI